MPVDKAIWKKFDIHEGDILPFAPWAEHATRTQLAELFGELGYTSGAEIGVRCGYYSRELLGKNENLKLFLVDTWAPYLTVTQKIQDIYLRRCKEGLDKRGLSDRAIYMKMTSVEASFQIPDESLDFVYVDSVHEFDHAMIDIILWSKKVKPGGIVSGHDYHCGYQIGVTYAVNVYTQVHRINQWYITKEQEPSWFFVRPATLSPGGFKLP